MEQSIKESDIKQECLTCKWYYLAECQCEDSIFHGQYRFLEDTCDEWELDDVARRIYECL